jgi:hypothetical protein
MSFLRKEYRKAPSILLIKNAIDTFIWQITII